jgi:hypothetical protein
MNKNQLNKFRMYEAVNLVLDTHPAQVGNEGDLFMAQQLLKSGQEIIGQNRQVQEADTSGLTQKKRELRNELIKLMLLFAVGLKAQATIAKDLELKTKADYKPSELKTSTDDRLFDIAALLKGLALPLRSDLVRYFIGETQFREMERLLAEFKLAIPKRRVAINRSKTSTSNIAGVFKSQDKLLKEHLDALVAPFQFSQPDFFHAYRNARSIVGYTGRGKAEKVVTEKIP